MEKCKFWRPGRFFLDGRFGQFSVNPNFRTRPHVSSFHAIRHENRRRMERFEKSKQRIWDPRREKTCRAEPIWPKNGFLINWLLVLSTDCLVDLVRSGSSFCATWIKYRVKQTILDPFREKTVFRPDWFRSARSQQMQIQTSRNSSPKPCTSKKHRNLKVTKKRGSLGEFEGTPWEIRMKKEPWTTRGNPRDPLGNPNSKFFWSPTLAAL